MVSLTENSVNHYDLINSSEPKLISSAKLEAKGQPKFTNCKWNPHHNNSQIATCNDTAIRGWDLKSMKYFKQLNIFLLVLNKKSYKLFPLDNVLQLKIHITNLCEILILTQINNIIWPQ